MIWGLATLPWGELGMEESLASLVIGKTTGIVTDDLCKGKFCNMLCGNGLRISLGQ